MKHIAIVGAGLAGLTAATEIRRQGWSGDLTILGDEPHPPYRRPPLSKEFLLEEHLPEVRLPQATDIHASWLLGHLVTAVDLHRRVLYRGSAPELRFDGLVVASGVSARRPPPNLDDRDGVVTLRTLEDAHRLRAALTDSRSVLVVGAGFLGNELAAAVRSRGHRVTVVERELVPLLAALGEQLGKQVAELHQDHRVDLRLGRQILRLAGRPRVREAHLDDGSVVPADLVIHALGSRPNTDWLFGSGLTLENGVVVDHTCAAAPGVVAIGDVARWPHPLLGDRSVRLEHYANALDQGARGARTLLGINNVDPPPVPSFWSNFYSWRLQSVGFTGDAFEYHTVEADPSGKFVGEYRHEGRLVGAIANRRPRAVAGYREALLKELR